MSTYIYFVPHLDSWLRTKSNATLVLEQAFSLATGLLVYINVVFTLVLAGFLAAMPCVRSDDAKLSLWDYVKILAQMD